MEGYDEEDQGPLGIEPCRGHQGQQEGLLQEHQQ